MYSRQLAVLGHEAMSKMQSSNVLIVGMGGLGLEIAKNVTLGGVRSLSIFDPAPATMLDLSSQYYMTEADVGKPRAAVTQPKLAELNPHVCIDRACYRLNKLVYIAIPTDYVYIMLAKRESALEGGREGGREGEGQPTKGSLLGESAKGGRGAEGGRVYYGER